MAKCRALLKFALMEVDDKLMDKLASLSKLEFKDADRESMKADIQRMLSFFEELNSINTDGLEPLIHVNPEKNVYRADAITEELTQAQALKNGPNHDSFYFKVPKVVENKD